MTEEQIIKVAEYCSSGGSCIGCVREHNIFQYASDCRYDLLKSLVIISNRQKAEIERLKSENERILSNCRWCEENYVETAKKAIKSEAIKEFAERVKNMSEDCTDYGQEYVLCKDIDKLVEEMVGDE